MTKTALLLSFLLWLPSLTPAASGNGEDRSGPTIMLQSVVYQIGNTWHCPLCRQEVKNGDRTGIDLKLCLSEWHDVYLDSAYFHDKIRYVTDQEIVASLDIPTLQPTLEAASKARDHARIALLLKDYFASRSDNRRLSTYDRLNKKHFMTIDEFRNDVARDSLRRTGIIEGMRTLYTPAHGFTLHGVHWGKTIDFNYTYPNISKYGVHYLNFLNDLTSYYVLTGDPATPAVFEDAFNQWYDQLDSVRAEHVLNMTTSYDFIWYELGLSNRTQRLIDAYRVFGKEVSPETHLRLLKIILGSSRWLNECLRQTPFHPYNWQTHTAFTVSYAAVVFPEFTESGAWLERGRNNMVLHLERDILDDGGYVERTSSYADYMFSIYYRTMLMLEYFRDDPSLKDRYLGRLEKYMEFFTLTISPLGVNTPFNDASRSKGLVPLFKDMGEFFHRGDFIGAVRQEFSPEALAAMSVPVAVPTTKSIDFPEARYAVMRDDWDPSSYFMMINYGDWQNHTHYDQLSFEIYANGIPIALDAGIGPLGYLDSLHVRWYKHPLAHNMLTINHAVPEKRDRPGYDKVWSPLKETEIFAATHDGYLPYQKARHRRHVIYAKRQYWLIIDEVRTGGHDQEIEFHLHTPCTMTDTQDGYISREENGFLIKHDQDDSTITKSKASGPANLGGISGEPPNREIDWLVFQKRLTGEERPNRMATLIYPFAARGTLDPGDVSVEELALEDPVAIGYLVRSRGHSDIILVSDGQYRKFTPSIAGDFRYGRISLEGDRLTYAALTDMTRYSIEGMGEETLPSRQNRELQR